MPYGVTFPSSLSGKSWSRTRTGSPFGRHSRPFCAYCPTCSFFLASTLTTGSPAARNPAARPLIYRNWASRSGCCLPSIVIEVPWVLYPRPCSIRSTASFPHRCPCRVSSPARFSADFVVHFSGETGFPRVESSTSASSAGINPGSLSSALLRPPPPPPPPPRARPPPPPPIPSAPPPPPPAPPPRSPHAPAPAPPTPGTAAAAAHPDAAASPRTSPPALP